MKKRMSVVALVLLFILFSCFYARAEDEMQREIKFGKEVSEEIEQHWERVSDPVKIAHLSMICEKIKPHMTRTLPFEIRIIQEKSLNAFSLPGGIIYMTTGILDFLHSDAEIGAIIAHEMIHADRRHVMLQMAQSQRISIFALALILVSGGKAAPAFLTSMAQIAITNAYSKDLEKEADVEGLYALQKAGYPPAAALTVMEGLAEEQLRHPYVDPGIFMDHPYVKERVAYLSKIIRENNWPIERKKVLHMLVVDVVTDERSTTLLVDGVKVWSGPDESDVRKLFLSIKEKLDKDYQMELAPYEIEVIELFDNKKGIRVGPTLLVSEPLPGGVDPLIFLRTGLVERLHQAKASHPMADYLH